MAEDQAVKASRGFSVLRAAATTGGATLLSRVTGFVRDVALAAMLGAGPLAEIFVVAFRLPNLFRRLFAEGAFSAAFVPLYAAQREAGGPAAAQRFAGEVLWALSALLVLFTGAALAFMPALVAAIAAGFTRDSGQFEDAVYYARIAFPYLACMSLTSLFAALLNASGRFLVPALAPVLLNLVLLAAMGIAVSYGGFALDYIMGGVVLAGFLQLGWVVVAALRVGLGVPLLWPRATPNVRRFGGLALPGVLAAGVGQINLLVGTSIATFQAGAAAWLYYADRLYQLPMGVIGVALGIALLPDLSRRLAEKDEAGARQSMDRALLAAMLFTLPAAFGLAVLAEPVVTALFERAAFTAADSRATAQAVQLFCFGLPAFVLVRVLQPAFFARQDTRAPFIDGAAGVVCNIALSLLLFGALGHMALALATSLAGWLTVMLMATRLARRGIWRLRVPVAARLFRQVAAGVAMSAAIFGLWSVWTPAAQLGGLIVWLAAQIALGGALYFVVALGLNARRGVRHMLGVDAAAATNGGG